MTDLPWDRVLRGLSSHGCIFLPEVENRLPVARVGELLVTNLPLPRTCPNGVPLIVLRIARDAQQIDVDGFLKEFIEAS